MEAKSPAEDNCVTIKKPEKSPNHTMEEDARQMVLDSWTKLPAAIKISEMSKAEKRADDEVKTLGAIAEESEGQENDTTLDEAVRPKLVAAKDVDKQLIKREAKVRKIL